MTTLFPDMATDIAVAMERINDAVCWEARIAAVDRWLDYCALRALTTPGEWERFTELHHAITTAFNGRAWNVVDKLLEMMEREYG